MICCTCSLGHPGCSCHLVLLPSRDPAPRSWVHKGRGYGTRRAPACNGGSCLCILQFGSYSTDVWGRPPLPLPLLLSAWPIPARVSAVPHGEGGGLCQSSGPSPAVDHLVLPGEQVSWALCRGHGSPRLWGPGQCPKSLTDRERSPSLAWLLLWSGSLLLYRLAFSPCGAGPMGTSRSRPGHSDNVTGAPHGPGHSQSQPPDLGVFPTCTRGETSPPHTEHSSLPHPYYLPVQRQDLPKPEKLPSACSEHRTLLGSFKCCQRPYRAWQ